MAHELTINRETGKADALYVRTPAWHRLGQVFLTPPDRRTAMREANLDFEVEVVPDYVRKRTEDGGDYYYTASLTGRKVLRTDTQQELGTVGTRYSALQNEDAFRVLDPLLDSGAATIDAAFSLREGADVVMVVKFDLQRFGPTAQQVLGDEVLPFGMIANNHNGRRGALFQVLPYRVECANMLGMAEGKIQSDVALGRAVVLKHTGDMEVKAVEAAEHLFAGLIARYEVVARQYRLLKSQILEEAEFRRYVLDVIAPDPRKSPKFNPEASRAQLVIDRADAKRNALTHLWENGAGHTGDHSAWEAYNGVAEALDHNEDLWPSRGGAWRTASVISGTYDQMKQTVLTKLVKHAQSA